MKFSLRRSNQEAEDVRWLAPTRIRQPRSRYRLIGLLAVLLLAASAAVIGFVVMGGGQKTAQNAAGTPSGRLASAPPEPAAPPDTSATRPLSPVSPTPSQRVAEPPASPAPPPEPVPEAVAPPAEPSPPPANAEADQGASGSSVAGAFPAPSEPASDDPEAPNFAVYLNEAAPDEAGARALLADAQRRYASALEGGRLSYRRVRVSDGYAWRLRLSGLTRARAQEACQALTGLGAGCEIGPR